MEKNYNKENVKRYVRDVRKEHIAGVTNETTRGVQARREQAENTLSEENDVIKPKEER